MIDRHGERYGNRARGMRMVMLAVADAANVDGEHAHPGINGIVGFSLYSRGQVGKLLGELVEEGWLEVEEEGGGRGRATVYRIPRMSEETAHSVARFPSGNRAVSDEKPRTPDTETAHSEAETAHPRVRANGSNNGTSNGTPNEHLPLPGVEAPPEPPPDRFDEFWAVYPRHVDKANARRAWAKATKTVDPQTIIDGAIRYGAYVTAERTEPKYVKHPSSWLNAERWGDELVASKPVTRNRIIGPDDGQSGVIDPSEIWGDE
jgi:hypothetical protein